MFCQEIELYVNYFEKIISSMGESVAEINYLKTFRENLENGMDLILEISEQKAYPNENLKSIPTFVETQRERLRIISLSKLELPVAVNY
jgi:hypothetical protein